MNTLHGWGPLTEEAYRLRRALNRSLNRHDGGFTRRYRLWLKAWARFKRRYAAGL